MLFGHRLSEIKFTNKYNVYCSFVNVISEHRLSEIKFTNKYNVYCSFVNVISESQGPKHKAY